MKYIPLLALAIAADAFRVFALMKLWAWFLVTSLAAPALGYWQVAGIWLVVGLLWSRLPDQRIEDQRADDKRYYDAWVKGFSSLFTSLAFLTLGYFVAQALP